MAIQETKINPLIEAGIRSRGQEVMGAGSGISREELIQLSREGKVTHMGGPLPDFLKDVVAEAKDAGKETKDAVGGGTIGGINVSDITLDVLQGIKTMDTLEETDRAVVESELDQLGFNSDAPPKWFIDASREDGVSPEEVDSVWNETRNEIMGATEQPLQSEQPII